MEGVSTFLESSTVHGLSYISTTRKYARIFWILVVIGGFVAASLLIKESFDSWSESPIKTTIETLPISKIKLPRVTVCPPKNTFTDLNYDLTITENMTLTVEQRDEMFEYAVKIINEDSLSANNWTKLIEKDRFFNWYHGISQIKSPSWYYSAFLGKEYLDYTIETTAKSGVVTTQYFGEQFKSELVEKRVIYKVNVSPGSFSVLVNENVTLHLKVEKVSMKGLPRSSKEEVIVHGYGQGFVDPEQTIVYTNFTPPEYDRYIDVARDVNFKEVEQLKLNLMPGFKFSWWYSGVEFRQNARFKKDDIAKHYVR